MVMGMILAYIKKSFSREEFYKNYYSYFILTSQLKQQIFKLEKLGKYSRHFRHKLFLKIFVTIPEIKKTVEEREKAYNTLKDSYEKFTNNLNETSKITAKYKEYFQFINEERDLEYKNGFLDLINTIINDLDKVYINMEDANNIILHKKYHS